MPVKLLPEYPWNAYRSKIAGSVWLWRNEMDGAGALDVADEVVDKVVVVVEVAAALHKG